MAVVSECRYVKLEGTCCFIAGSPEAGALASAPVAQGQCQGPSLVPSFHSAILGVLVFYPHAEPSMLLQGLTEAGGSGVAMVERVSICCPWLLSENEIQNPSRLLIIFLV